MYIDISVRVSLFGFVIGVISQCTDPSDHTYVSRAMMLKYPCTGQQVNKYPPILIFVNVLWTVHRDIFAQYEPT
jgi:hypothetical protein